MKISIQPGKLIFSLLVVLVHFPLSSEYPLIGEFSKHDPLFMQLQEDIQRHYRSVYSNLSPPPLQIFRYRCQGKEDLFSLAARLNLPYETLASLNHFGSITTPEPESTLLIPNRAGLFISHTPLNDLDEIMTAHRGNELKNALEITINREKTKERFYFFAGARFHPIERAFFLKILFKFPLEKRGPLSSSFGARSNPFTGHPEFHGGIDIPAPIGTVVIAAREGNVQSTGYNAVYGHYIILDHAGNYLTVYGHLSEINVTFNQKVRTGMQIGKVGTSGRSTGPHLHFEIRKNGDPKDPEPLLR